MTATGHNLPPEQHRAAELLALGHDPTGVASTVGVSLRTLRRWRTRPDFADVVTGATTATFAEARAVVLAASVAAATTARTLMEDTSTPPAVRARLALGLLDLAPDFAENDQTERLDRLEQRLHAITAARELSAWTKD